MSFSFAVSLSLLLMVESIRYGTLTQKKSPLHSPPGLNSNGNHLVETGKETSNAVNALNDFFNAFLGDHDTSNAFVITHILLIFGCAFPLWWYLLWSPLIRFDPLLPYIGIITLGIGDSFGAIFGVLIGHNCWPGSKRTLEGSMSMFFSMQISIMIGRRVSLDACLYTSLPISLLEACTSQIDNLYLPLMATGLMMLETIR
jgi:dolichol kinase